MGEQEPMELEPGGGFEPVQDTRPRMDEPLPVRLVAVADVRLPAQAGLERESNEFYCDLLKMVRDEPLTDRIYRADNFRIVFELVEGLIEREAVRPLGVEVELFGELESQLIEREIPYERIKGLAPGVESLMLRDPSGNWVEIFDGRRVF